MAIEILENTLLKLLVRRGTDFDRKQITLATGELGYATDTERLYIGNDVDAGGILVGNKWKGSRAGLAGTIAGVLTGDIAYDTSTNTLNVLVAGTGNNASDWYTVADNVSAGNDTINFSVNNSITVGTLSAGNFHADALGDSIELDGSNRIALSGSVNINAVCIRDTTSDSYLTLPQRIKINPEQRTVYSFPAGSPSNNDYLRSDGPDDSGLGILRWAPYQVIETAVSPTTASNIPVATIVPFASGGPQVPYGWLECDGTLYAGATYKDLSGVIGNAYGGDDVNFNVPNLVDKVLYGSSVSPPVNSNLMGVVTGANPDFPGLSATGMTYIIKAVNGVTSPTLTVRKNLSCFVNGVNQTLSTFNPLSGNIVIERPAPGMQTFSTAGSHTFTTPPGITYMKYHVTGSGANGGVNTGGAAATVIGNISAAPGTTFTVCVATKPPLQDQGFGGFCSSIYTCADATCVIAASYGGVYIQDNDDDGSGMGKIGQGIVGTQPENMPGGDPILGNGFVFIGGQGGVDTSGNGDHPGYEESEGAASYWGSSPAPGAGSGSHGAGPGGARGYPTSQAGEGFVMFEWN